MPLPLGPFCFSGCHGERLAALGGWAGAGGRAREVLTPSLLSVRANLIPSPPTFNSDYGYISWEAYANVSYYTRILPPVPDNCPTPMGTKGSWLAQGDRPHAEPAVGLSRCSSTLGPYLVQHRCFVPAHAEAFAAVDTP